MTLRQKRIEFFRYIGCEVEIKRAHVGKLPSHIGLLVDVKRSRAVIEFPGVTKEIVTHDRFGASTAHIVTAAWFVPLNFLLFPGCVESDPRQMELFK